MPCVLLLCETQHSRLLEDAQDLADTAASGDADWLDRLRRFRRALGTHDDMEREVLRELGVRAAPVQLSAALDLIVAAEGDLKAEAIPTIARKAARIIEDHALAQETGLFPNLVERHALKLRHQLGSRYFLGGANRWLAREGSAAAV